MSMLRISPTFEPETGTVRFLPAVRATADDGDATVSYGADFSTAGVVVHANLQADDGERKVVDGVDHYVTPTVGVCLMDDPSSLNGGLGVRRGDAFWWSSDPTRLMVARSDANKQGSVWRVRCEFSQ